eukprot:TRINITY_DN7010_c0_g1_i1.p1 TRINITY_DN7010_c0_g1~~TRINITY_DN7010_c0_g1_i1.p1  ORF type:complete len:496 (-),score=132.62 TRINITY_DN7010_c0_g1_i1:123-1433(-)
MERLSEENLFKLSTDSLEEIQSFSDQKIPESLLRFLERCRDLSLRKLSSDFVEKAADDISQKIPSDSTVFRGMSPKKRHEVERLIPVILNLMEGKPEGEFRIIDVGSGEGYLSSVLSYSYGLKVTGIDAQYSEGANRRKSVLVKEIAAKYAKEDRGEIKEKLEEDLNFIEFYLTSEIDEEGFRKLCGGNLGEKIIMIGLHTCGSLACTMLKLFVECDFIDAFVGVGCCYYKGNLRDIFLLSKTMKEKEKSTDRFPRFDLQSWYLACESTEMWREMTSEEKKYTLRRRFFRSLLEIALRRALESYGFEGHFTVRKVKKKQCESFEDYFEACLEKLKFNPERNDLGLLQIVREFWNPREKLKKLEMEYEGQMIQLISFHALQLCVAPLMESISVLDRHLYLAENNIRSAIIPLFKESTSPRNLVLVGTKRSFIESTNG